MIMERRTTEPLRLRVCLLTGWEQAWTEQVHGGPVSGAAKNRRISGRQTGRRASAGHLWVFPIKSTTCDLGYLDALQPVLSLLAGGIIQSLGVVEGCFRLRNRLHGKLG
jgi:hypothetical protein